MRFSLALLILSAFPLSAAPVPKELRTPAIVGTWEITESNVWGERSPQYNGQRWLLRRRWHLHHLGAAARRRLRPARLRGSYVLGRATVKVWENQYTVRRCPIGRAGADIVRERRSASGASVR